MDMNYMNQTCKVCGEPAAGFHFGAFTCEGCKSFFGRSYNNVSAMTECKNNNKCIINKKNRTSCKSCRLRKCMMVGMSKSGSRYGRRSNWFKIHCLLQEQQQKHLQENGTASGESNSQEHLPSAMSAPPGPHHMGMSLLHNSVFNHSLMGMPRAHEDMLMMKMEEFKPSASPSVGSPESLNSLNSDTSIEFSDRRLPAVIPGLLPPPFLHPSGMILPPGIPTFYPALLPHSPFSFNSLNCLNPTTTNNNNEKLQAGPSSETKVKREYLDAVLQLQRASTSRASSSRATPAPVEDDEELDVNGCPEQETAMDLSMKPSSSGRASSSSGAPSEGSSASSDTERRSVGDDSDCDSLGAVGIVRPSVLDLTNRV